jgi:hypothetical protein
MGIFYKTHRYRALKSFSKVPIAHRMSLAMVPLWIQHAVGALTGVSKTQAQAGVSRQ